MAQSKAESFTAYLEEKQRLERLPKPAAGGAGGAVLPLLAVLAAAPGRPMAVSALQAASGMSFLDFSNALKRLADAGYLTLSGAPGQETALLTKLGAEVAEVVSQ